MQLFVSSQFLSSCLITTLLFTHLLFLRTCLTHTLAFFYYLCLHAHESNFFNNTFNSIYFSYIIENTHEISIEHLNFNSNLICDNTCISCLLVILKRFPLNINLLTVQGLVQYTFVYQPKIICAFLLATHVAI